MKRDKFNLIASGEIAQSGYHYQIGEINKHWTVRITKDNDMIRVFEYNELITDSPPPPPLEGLIGWFHSQTKANLFKLNSGQLEETIKIVNSEAMQITFLDREINDNRDDNRGLIFY